MGRSGSGKTGQLVATDDRALSTAAVADRALHMPIGAERHQPGDRDIGKSATRYGSGAIPHKLRFRIAVRPGQAACRFHSRIVNIQAAFIRAGIASRHLNDCLQLYSHIDLLPNTAGYEMWRAGNAHGDQVARCSWEEDWSRFDICGGLLEWERDQCIGVAFARGHVGGGEGRRHPHRARDVVSAGT